MANGIESLKEHSQEALKRAYDKGYELSDAVWIWGDAETKAAIENLKAPPTPTSTSDQIANLKSLVPVFDHIGKRSELDWRLRDRLFAFLRTRQLLALGYALPRNPDDNLRIVPDDLLDWRHKGLMASTLKANGLHFAAVRVIHPDWLALDKPDHADQKATALSISLPPKGRPGRKSKRDTIVAAYRELADAGRFDNAASQRDAGLLTRQLILERLPAGGKGEKGYSLETIRRTINDIISGKL